ncbi:hypothetical protein L914_00068 [Phytophthora nicotianae]|uniref:Transmembrane protein n=1 Tax=Phytophthora nicotianae TaxID=4792 RepID=W2PAN9_PHYNI|nr:hypothetical protein L914_00068 [Phytophthora nicotianae]
MPPSPNMPENLNPSVRGEDRCDLDVYSLFGESVDDTIAVNPVHPQQPRNNNLPRISVMSRAEPRQSPAGRRSAVVLDGDRRTTRLHSEENEAPFSGGICRQLAAMYTDVGMTTVERVRWLCGWMILVYALTCCAWFAWPAYSVPLVGILTGTAGLLACQRPHEQSYMLYVLAFTALNYAQIAQLVWLVFITVSTELAVKCIDDCASTETKTVFIVLLVVATGVFHWRVVTITRQYVREFRMIPHLTAWRSEAYFYDASYSRAAASSTMGTESSVSDASVAVVSESERQSTVPYHTDNTQLTRL